MSVLLCIAAMFLGLKMSAQNECINGRDILIYSVETARTQHVLI